MKKTILVILMTASVLLASACGSPGIPDSERDNINPAGIRVISAAGLNEQIRLSLARPSEGTLSVSYRPCGGSEFIPVDRDLLLDEGDSVGCYILGLAEGKYDVRIETSADELLSRVTLAGIDVGRQDRSGYAHFGREDGIGGYNNDGTVKDGAKIIYLTNENKNTVTLDIDGEEGPGLPVDIECMHSAINLVVPKEEDAL